jgi:SAM-dependent methyltransferase
MGTDKKLSKNLVLAIDWAAAEYNYIVDLKKELEDVQKEKSVKKEIKDIKKAIKILHYIAKAERRAFYFEKDVGKELKDIFSDLSEHLKHDFQIKQELFKIIRKINIEHNVLIKYASFYEGSLAQGLDEAKAKLKEELKEKDLEKSNQIHEGLLLLISKIQTQVTDADKWIKSLEASLKKVQDILKEIPDEDKSHIKEKRMRLQEDLVKEQISLQEGNNTKQDRNLNDYSSLLDFNEIHEKGLLGVLKSIYEEKGEITWVDLGCGLGRAQIEAKSKLDQEGLDLSNCNFYGVDILSDYNKHFTNMIDPKYKPTYLSQDIETVNFPQKADLVTCCSVLRWVRDPLKVISNALKQTKIGGIISFDDLSPLNIRYLKKNSNVFRILCYNHWELLNQGLDILNEDNKTILAKKTSEPKLAINFKLTKRIQIPYLDGFSFEYSID